MSSFALRAAILVTIESHAGTWCALPALAGRVVRPQHEVKVLCDQLVEVGEIQHARLPDGTSCYGIACPVAEEVPL
jgi:hypothetical protein